MRLYNDIFTSKSINATVHPMNHFIAGAHSIFNSIEILRHQAINVIPPSPHYFQLQESILWFLDIQFSLSYHINAGFRSSLENGHSTGYCLFVGMQGIHINNLWTKIQHCLMHISTKMPYILFNCRTMIFNKNN